MKKIIPVVVILLILAVVIIYALTNKNTIKSAKLVDSLKYEKVQNSIATIQDAMKSGRQMQCSYTFGTGESALYSTVIVEGKKFKSESLVNGARVYAMSDGTTQYVWNDTDKKGTRIDKSCLDDLKDEMNKLKTESQSDPASAQDYQKAFEMANNVKCDSVSQKINFSVPSNIVFTDQCAMIKQSLELMKKYKNNQ